MTNSDACIFCQIVAGTLPSQRVYADEHAIAFLDINPVTDGHTLVVPTHHASDIWEIGEHEACNLITATIRVAHQITRALRPDGVNLVHASGKAAWQDVFHFHLHVVPRYVDDGLNRWWVSVPGDPSRMTEIAQRIAQAT